MASSADYTQWLRYKEEFAIEVNEDAPQFSQWMKIFLLMMRHAQNEVSCSFEAAARPQCWDCCVVCSDSDDDLAIAEEFRKNLEKGGYFACLLQDVPPGGRLQDSAEAMLRGSTVIFILCTADLVLDRGIARMAYQDCLATHLSNSARAKKIVPVVVPTPVPDSQSHDVVGASDGSLVRTNLRRVHPMGAILFRPICLTRPDAYMEQVSRCISVNEQQHVRDERQLQVETRRLLQEKQIRQSQERAVAEALKLFRSALPAGTLLKIENGLSIAPTRETDLALPGDPRIRERLRNLPPGSLDSHAPSRQTVDLIDCKEVSIGTSFHFHIQDSTSF